MFNIQHLSHPQTYILLVPWQCKIENKRKTKTITTLPPLSRETIAFSICNKPFKPLGPPSGRVKSREGLPWMIPTNIMQKFMFIPRSLVSPKL
jgi:hypothetical protein